VSKWYDIPLIGSVRGDAGGKELPSFVVLVSPHSDDVALSLGAALLGSTKSECMHIVTVFSISKNTAADLIKDVKIVTAIRMDEDRSFFLELGRDVRAVWLGREDAPLRLGLPDESVFSCCRTDADLCETRHIVNRLRAEYSAGSLLLAPMGLGNHIDHLIVRDAALALLREGFSVGFYEDLPYAADVSENNVLEYSVQLGLLAGEELMLSAIETDIAIQEKIDLLSCYRSQMDSRTADRVRTHTERSGKGSVVERVWGPRRTVMALARCFRGARA